VEENESQKVLQVYPGFWSCVSVGTNHPVHPETDWAVVFASFLQYQVLETSLVFGATTQLVPPARQIRNPPSKESPRFAPDVVKLYSTPPVVFTPTNPVIAVEGMTKNTSVAKGSTGGTAVVE
jgi:hypothetical protein